MIPDFKIQSIEKVFFIYEISSWFSIAVRNNYFACEKCLLVKCLPLLCSFKRKIRITLCWRLVFLFQNTFTGTAATFTFAFPIQFSQRKPSVYFFLHIKYVRAFNGKQQKTQITTLNFSVCGLYWSWTPFLKIAPSLSPPLNSVLFLFGYFIFLKFLFDIL